MADRKTESRGHDDVADDNLRNVEGVEVADLLDSIPEDDPAERALWAEQSRYVSHYWKVATHPRVDFGLENMLGTAKRKVGPKKYVRVFNRSLAATCRKPDARGAKIATPLCEQCCYATNLLQCCPNLMWQLRTNDLIARRRDFADIMIGAIIEEFEVNWSLDIFKIHVIGDFDRPSYVDAWTTITSTVHRLLSGHVVFLCYTRAWRRGRLMPALSRLNAVPGTNLLLSYDATCDRLPPESDEWKTALLLDRGDKGSRVLENTHIVFRSRSARSRAKHPLKRFVDATSGLIARICPHQTGLPGGPESCVQCRACLFKNRPS